MNKRNKQCSIKGRFREIAHDKNGNKLKTPVAKKITKKRDPHIRAAGLLLALEKEYPNKFCPNDLRYHFTTGRLPTKIESKIMKYVDANKLSDAYSELNHGFEYFEGLKKAPKLELIEKGWLKKSDITLAKNLKKYLKNC